MKQVSITNAVKIKNQRVKPFDGEKKYLATGGLIEDTIKTEVITYKSKPTRADLLLTENQLIVARMKGTNKVLLINNNTTNLIVSTGFLVLEVQKGWHPRFLFHYLVSSFFQKQKDRLSIGATQKAINNEKFKEILIPEISYEDQKRIVKILDEADTLRQKRKQSIRLLDEYLRSVFLDMFGDPVKNEKGWEIKILGDLANEFKYGTNMISDYKNSDNKIPILRIPNIVGEKISYFNLKYSIIDKKEKEKIKLKNDDILFVRTNGNPAYIGRCAVFHDSIECGYASYLIRVRLKESSSVTANFIRDVISFPTYRHLVIKKAKTTAGNYNINTESLKSLKIYQPPLFLQNEFANLVKKTETIKQKMLVQSEEMEKQFQVLMQRSFT